MKGKVIKQEKGCYLKLPEEFRGMEEVEFFELKKGYYLLSEVIGEGGSAPAKKEKGAEELLVEKLDSIPMGKRSPTYLKKVLGKEEQKLLEALVKKGKVAYIHNKKFEEGIYVIDDGRWKKGKGRAGGNTNEFASALFASGYVIVEGNRDAQALSERLLNQKGSIMGVRGFDGKYYVVTANYFRKVSGALVKMGREVSPENAAAKFGLSMEGCRAVLKLLAEKGDYIEKKGDLYIRV